MIVGAGLFGATFAYMARQAGKRCLVIDKRSHVGGNVYCENVRGINVHKYGAHIFHTSDREVWDFVNRFVEFNNYVNSPIAKAPDGKIYNLPFNMNTFNRLWGVATPTEALERIDQQRARMTEQLAREGIDEPQNLEQQAISLVGEDIYRLLIEGYTEKQWGRRCEELPAFIIRRLPVRLTYDNNYFNDRYQGIPIGGYNRLIDGLLEGIEVRLDTDFFDNRQALTDMAETLVYTGPIDQFFDYRFGHLDYRSLRFETETLDNPNFQGNAVVNFTSADVPYTRTIEHKHFESFGQEVYANPSTVVTYEYPSEWTPGAEPFYPVNDRKNQATYQKYQELTADCQNVIFGGRLAEYRYYDMAPTVAKALSLWK